LLEMRPDGKTALLAWAGSGHTIVPTTDDTAVIEPFLSALSPEVMPQPGDRLESLAPRLALELEGHDAATVLFITDGVTPEGASAMPAALGDATVVIWPVGEGAGFDRASLDDLARKTGATVQPLTLGPGDLGAVLDALEAARRRHVDPSDVAQWDDRGRTIMLLVAAMLLFWFRRGWVVQATMMSLFILQTGCASAFLTPDQQGARAMRAGDYARAAGLFEDPMWRGLALYAQKDWTGAVAAFDQVDTPEGHFNRGNALAQQKSLLSAVKAYDKALALRPTFEEARANRDLMQATIDGLRESADTDVINKAGPTTPSDELAIQMAAERSFDQRPEAGRAVIDDDPLTPAEMELWMRRVQTKPQDFLRQKLIVQAREDR